MNARRLFAALTVSFLILSSACPDVKTESSGNAASEATLFTSISELSKASAAVVEVTVLPDSKTVAADSAGTSGLMSTVSTVTVDSAIAGSVKQGGTILIRQLGIASDTGGDVTPILSVGKQYILFVAPFTFGAGTPPTGQFVITGDQGAYELTPAGGKLVSPNASGLPTTITTTDLIKAATATG